MLKEPRDAPKRAKKNEIERQSCLTSELSIIDFKRKRYEFLSLNEKGKADRFCYKRKKEKGEKPYLEKTKLRKEKVDGVQKVQRGKAQSNNGKRERERERERESKEGEEKLRGLKS